MERRLKERKEMKKVRAFFAGLIIVSLLALTSGCAGLMLYGKGQPISTVIEQWGTPTSVTPDRNGGNIYTWEKWIPSGEFSRYLWTSMYWADSNGIIYKWR
jgi:hypothetical protein